MGPPSLAAIWSSLDACFRNPQGFGASEHRTSSPGVMLSSMLIDIVAGAGGALAFILFAWIHYKYWWAGQISPEPSVDRNKFFALTGFRKGLRIFAGIFLILVSAVLFISGNILPGIAAVLLGVFSLITPFFLRQ
jgi:heme/copper-type cytochrome/quinol oxidase subunit 3